MISVKEMFAKAEPMTRTETKRALEMVDSLKRTVYFQMNVDYRVAVLGLEGDVYGRYLDYNSFKAAFEKLEKQLA